MQSTTLIAQALLCRLDVDKDHFDKFSMRNCIDSILLELWKDPGTCYNSSLYCYKTAIANNDVVHVIADSDCACHAMSDRNAACTLA